MRIQTSKLSEEEAYINQILGGKNFVPQWVEKMSTEFSRIS